MGLVAVSARHLGQHEAAALVLVAGGELGAGGLDALDRHLEQLGQHGGRHGFDGRQQDGLDGPVLLGESPSAEPSAVVLLDRVATADGGQHGRVRATTRPPGRRRSRPGRG